MTVRIPRTAHQEIDDKRIAALITRSILKPTNDDAPSSAAGSSSSAAWLDWGLGLQAAKSNLD